MSPPIMEMKILAAVSLTRSMLFLITASSCSLILRTVLRTINEPSDLGDENIDETVSANTLNDSLTIEKEINNEETPSQMTEFDISSIDNEQVGISDQIHVIFNYGVKLFTYFENGPGQFSACRTNPKPDSLLFG
jgi:hypothetical protein